MLKQGERWDGDGMILTDLNYNELRCNKSIRVIKYDKMYSLNVFLEKDNISEKEKEDILADINPLAKAITYYKQPRLNFARENIKYIYKDESISSSKLIKVWTLGEKSNNAIIEEAFMYMLLKIGDIILWDMREQGFIHYMSDSERGEPARVSSINVFLNFFSKTELRKISYWFDEDTMGCLFYALNNNDIWGEELMKIGMEYLCLNCQNIHTACGSLFNAFGRINVEYMIFTILKACMENVSCSLSNLFLLPPKKQVKNEIKNTVIVQDNGYQANLVYMLDNLEEYDNGVVLTYLFKQRECLKIYIDFIQNEADKARTLSEQVPARKFTIEELILCPYSMMPGEPFHVYMKKETYTDTGKSSKYPYIINFPFAKLSLLENGTIGKYLIFVNIGKQHIRIHGIIKNNEMSLRKIEKMTECGMVELYNISK